MAGMLMEAIVQTLPPSDDTKPEYVVPPEIPSVDPNVGSAAAKVMTVLEYVWGAMVPLQPSSHSVPVP